MGRAVWREILVNNLPHKKLGPYVTLNNTWTPNCANRLTTCRLLYLQHYYLIQIPVYPFKEKTYWEKLLDLITRLTMCKTTSYLTWQRYKTIITICRTQKDILIRQTIEKENIVMFCNSTHRWLLVWVLLICKELILTAETVMYTCSQV